MSATVSPPEFYAETLGIEDAVSVRVSNAFPRDNRRVIVVPRVSTAYRDRPHQVDAIASLMAACIVAIPGNVAAYFSSYEMLGDVTSRWTLPGRRILLQEKQMSPNVRQEWLDALSVADAPVVLGAVLGGIFAEGIDLPPGALNGVLVCGPALPPVGLLRTALREYYDVRIGDGFRYASLIPGMTRVVQAAGRLVRRTEDRGVIVLFDRRFRWRDVASLLPDDWSVDCPDDPVNAIEAFWRNTIDGS